MKALRNWLLLSVVACCTLPSCRKNDTPPEIPAFFSLPEGLKDHFLFYPGSYWIFKEDSTQWSDSIYIKEILIDTVALISPGNRNDTLTTSERLTVRMHTPFFGFDHIFTSQLDLQGWIRDKNGPHFIMRRRSFHNNELQPIGNIFYWPLLPEGTLQAGAGGFSTLLQYQPAVYTLDNGLTFDQVIKTEIDQDASEFNQNTSYLFIAGKGIIARTSITNRLYWEIVRGRVISAPGDTTYLP